MLFRKFPQNTSSYNLRRRGNVPAVTPISPNVSHTRRAKIVSQ